MRLLVKLLKAMWENFTAPPAVPCCASAIHWASFH